MNEIDKQTDTNWPVEEEKPPPRWLRVVLIAGAIAMLGCGIFWQQRLIKDRIAGTENGSPSTQPKPLQEDQPPEDVYTWQEDYDPANSIANRIPTPRGFVRTEVTPASFGHWLRYLPLKPGEQKVMLHNGQPKRNQRAHFAVIDIDTGSEDLQQCADAIMRLRAEYLFAADMWNEISFDFTSGHPCPWAMWATGERPVVKGNKVTWAKKAKPDDSYETFRKYLRTVFVYAGTISLDKQLVAVESGEIQIGDVFIHPGSPGHAVIVVDMAVQPSTGRRVFMLAQSFMPAQDMHILVNPTEEAMGPWYPLTKSAKLRTPEWTFKFSELKRFPAVQ